MAMQLDEFHQLLSPPGQRALQAASGLAPREVDFLRHFQALSKAYPPEVARAALEIAILRREAQSKFPFSEQLYLTREALEQASSWEVARHRAARYSGFRWVCDLGCSVGGDTFALAEAAFTLGIDHDPLRLAMAHANCTALDLGARAAFTQADLRAPLPVASPGAALFFDPARRRAGRRFHSVRAYQPPLDTVTNWLPHHPALGVKISPGVELAELEAYDAEVEFISLNGELKEAVLWFGPLKSAYRRATLLPGGQTLPVSSQQPPALPLAEPRGYLYEPDPALLRAGLVGLLGAELGAAQLDPDIAYLTAEQYQLTPFARVWAVEDWFPFGLKRLRAYLRARQVGRVTVKKRGSPLQPEDLIRKLRLQGEAERVVFLTHLRGKPIVVIATELQPVIHP